MGKAMRAVPRGFPVLNDFVCLFIGNLNKIIDHYGLGLDEIRVILAILELMPNGNCIFATKPVIAARLGMDDGSVSRIMEKLGETGLVVMHRGHPYFNPHIAFKCAMKGDEDDAQEMLDAGMAAIGA